MHVARFECANSSKRLLFWRFFFNHFLEKEKYRKIMVLLLSCFVCVCCAKLINRTLHGSASTLAYSHHKSAIIIIIRASNEAHISFWFCFLIFYHIFFSFSLFSCCCSIADDCVVCTVGATATQPLC